MTTHKRGWVHHESCDPVAYPFGNHRLPSLTPPAADSGGAVISSRLIHGGVPGAEKVLTASMQMLESASREYLAEVDAALLRAAQEEPRRRHLEAYLQQLHARREAAIRTKFQPLVSAIDAELERTKQAIVALTEALFGTKIPTAEVANFVAAVAPEAHAKPAASAPAAAVAEAVTVAVAPAPQPVVDPAVEAARRAERERAEEEARRQEEERAREAEERRREAEERYRQDDEKRRIEFEIWARSLRDRAEDLKRGATELDPRELKLLTEQLAFEGRSRQSKHRHDLVRAEWYSVASICEKCFGALTTIAKVYLNPLDIVVRGIRRDVNADWDLLHAKVTQELADLHEQMRMEKEHGEEADRRRKELEEREKEAQLRKEATAKQLEPKIENFVDSILSPAEFPIGQIRQFQHDLKDAVRLYLETAGATDWLIERIYHPQIRELFTLGGEFRVIRKKLERRDEMVRAEQEAGGPEQEEFDDDELEEAQRRELMELAGEGKDTASQHAAFENLFEGKAGMMAGGKRKATAEEDVKRFFGFREFEWAETSRTSGGDRRLVTKVEHGHVDIVFIVGRFLSKATADALRDASEKAGIPCLYLSHGYNKTSVCRAIEEYRATGTIPTI